MAFESLTERLSGIFKKLRGQARLTEANKSTASVYTLTSTGNDVPLNKSKRLTPFQVSAVFSFRYLDGSPVEYYTARFCRMIVYKHILPFRFETEQSDGQHYISSRT